MRKRNRNKPNQKGRNPTSRFARLDHRLLNSPAYRALSTAARALLVELTMLDNGENNGSLYLSIRDAAARLGMADLSAVRSAFDELQELGFIEMTEAASFHVKAAERSRARCWRLTWLAGPGRKGPSMAFMDSQPNPGTKAHKRMERGMRTLERFPHVLTRRGFPWGRGSDSSFLLDAGGQHGWHGRFHRTFGIGSSRRLMAA